MGLLRRLHIALYAYFVKWYRTRYILKVFQEAHSAELRQTPVNQWPLTMQRQTQEIAAIRAGRIDATPIVDRKSWQWPFLPASMNRLSIPIMKSCYSADTEVLTRRGWVAWPEVEDGEEFLTRVPSSGEIRYEKSERIVRQHYRGDMVNFDSAYVDISVTPEHRMFGWYRGERYDKLLTRRCGHFKFSTSRFVTAVEVEAYGSNERGQYRFCIPTSGAWRGSFPANYDARTGKLRLALPSDYVRPKGAWGIEGTEVDLHDWVAFLGIFTAEGSTRGSLSGMDVGPKSKLPHYQQAKIVDSKNADEGHNYQIRISQQLSSDAYDQIGALLRRLPFSWSEDGKGFSANSRLLHVLLRGQNTYTKMLPDWLKQLPVEYLEEFFEWACLGDGHHYSCGSRAYWTVSKTLADDMAEVLVKLGKDVQSVCTLQKGSKKWKLKKERQAPLYCVKEHKFFQPHAIDPYKSLCGVTREKYDGMVYCCTVPSGVVMVRRNGKVAWCGQSPYNLRRMSRTPVPRRAINLIKGAVISQPWDVRPINDVNPIDSPEAQKERCRIVRKMFAHPNKQDSMQTFLEQGLEDMCCLGAFVAEMRLTIDPERPIKLWPVNVESIRMFVSWSEATPDMPRYAQMTGLKGERGAILFYDDEMMYVRDNPSTDTPFGLGKMEVAFASVNDFLGVQGMSGRAGSDQVHKTFLWWEQPQTESAYQTVRRHIQNELEGQAKLSLIGGMKKPEVIEVNPVTEEDLLLGWQELLIRMIANAFDMSAMALGVEHDVNRAVGEVLADKDFRSAVVPMAKRLQEGLTRKVIHEKLGWYDLELVFLNLDDPDVATKMDMYSRMYQMNAIVPNEIRRGVGMRDMDKATHPSSELTQFECMMISTEATNLMQEQAQQRADERQAKQQEEMAKQQQQLSPDNPQPAIDEEKQFPKKPGAPQVPGAVPGKGVPGQPMLPAPGVSKAPAPKGITAPKKIGLPKFPTVGKVTAAEIAAMQPDEVQALMEETDHKPSQVLKKMDEQEGGILRQMSDELKDFFKDALAEELKSRKIKIQPQLLKKWEAELITKKNAQDKRISDFSRWLYQRGQRAGKPGVGSSPRSGAGRPGHLNPVRRG